MNYANSSKMSSKRKFNLINNIFAVRLAPDLTEISEKMFINCFLDQTLDLWSLGQRLPLSVTAHHTVELVSNPALAFLQYHKNK